MTVPHCWTANESGTRAIPVGQRHRKDDGARIRKRWYNETATVERCPLVNETAKMTVPALLAGGATRAARGRYPSVNETAKMTVPALLEGGAT